MANKVQTVFQRLENVFNGNGDSRQNIDAHRNTYDLSNHTVFSTTDKDKYEEKKLEMQQNKYLSDRWVKANSNLSLSAFAGLSNVKLMYRDADLMDAFPEIGAALDIYAEESCLNNQNGQTINVYSNSDRTKNILEDLFVNRLDLQMTAPMVIRAMCKYGNQFMLLNTDRKNGICGWKQLPVFNVERVENGVINPYGMATLSNNGKPEEKDLSTKFIWTDDNNTITPYRNWQIGHFRLLTNSIFLPYGVSILNPARRHWRMLSLMEDMMLIYRLERSVERRVYKIFVGAIDNADVPAYIEEIANQFKRTQIVDPMTGQIDLRKNILPVHKDTPIPLLDGRTITIENLAKEYESGKENYVYSVQDKTHKIVPGKVVWCGKNYTAEKLYKITLDDDSHMILAGEHEIIMRDGTKKRADEVSIGESVMPLYKKVDKNSNKLFDRYEKVYNPNIGKYEFTHRLVASEIAKGNDAYNTVHHKDFNKYNNSPNNLVWMDYNEHHKMHGDLARANWNDPEKRKKHIENLSKSCKGRIISDEAKAKISKAIKEKYSSGEFDFVRNILRKNITTYNKSQKHIEEARKRGLELGYRDEFRKYNESELHTIHNEIRRISNIKKWENPEIREKAIKNMTVKFDSFIWEELRNGILSNKITSQNGLIKYINENLIEYLLLHNSSKKLHHYKKVTKPLVKARIIENGFANFKEYYASIKKNHKIANVEIVGGDDVYCMTVVGLNGEEDRHNFALITWKADGSLNESGVFVSNCMDNDIFIPTRSENAPNPIDTLPAGNNLTAMDDIKFVQNKVLTALRMPKTFLNFEEAAGDGKNLALMDVRFTRTINRIQQAFLTELTKIASIHLYLLGFEDEITNFSLSMRNPSTQAEQLEIENISKKIAAVRDAVSDPGNGIPVYSWTRALKEIMHLSDSEIKTLLEELRLEKAIAQELANTPQIIQKTGVFDNVDRVYGEPNATYQGTQQGQQGDEGGFGGGGGGGLGGDFGGGLDELGGMGGEEAPDVNGEEGAMPMDQMGGGGEGAPEAGGGEPQAGGEQQPPMEAVSKNKPLILESGLHSKDIFEKILEKKSNDGKNIEMKRPKMFNKALKINEEYNKMISEIDSFIDEK